MIVTVQKVLRKCSRKAYLGAYLRSVSIYSSTPQLYRMPKTPVFLLRPKRPKKHKRLSAVTFSGPVSAIVPNVVGQMYGPASTTVGAAGFAVSLQPTISLTVPSGTVISQNPVGGTLAFTGSTVVLNVSIGTGVLTGDQQYIISLLPRAFTVSLQPRAFSINWTLGTALQLFDIKDPGESVNLTFNYVPGLNSGETLTGLPTVSVTTLQGTDPNPSAVLNGFAGLNSASTQIVQPVTAGVSGCEYEFVSSCVTTQGRTLVLVGGLPVRR